MPELEEHLVKDLETISREFEQTLAESGHEEAIEQLTRDIHLYLTKEVAKAKADDPDKPILILVDELHDDRTAGLMSYIVMRDAELHGINNLYFETGNNNINSSQSLSDAQFKYIRNCAPDQLLVPGRTFDNSQFILSHIPTVSEDASLHSADVNLDDGENFAKYTTNLSLRDKKMAETIAEGGNNATFTCGRFHSKGVFEALKDQFHVIGIHGGVTPKEEFAQQDKQRLKEDPGMQAWLKERPDLAPFYADKFFHQVFFALSNEDYSKTLDFSYGMQQFSVPAETAIALKTTLNPISTYKVVDKTLESISELEKNQNLNKDNRGWER